MKILCVTFWLGFITEKNNKFFNLCSLKLVMNFRVRKLSIDHSAASQGSRTQKHFPQTPIISPFNSSTLQLLILTPTLLFVANIVLEIYIVHRIQQLITKVHFDQTRPKQTNFIFVLFRIAQWKMDGNERKLD